MKVLRPGGEGRYALENTPFRKSCTPGTFRTQSKTRDNKKEEMRKTCQTRWLSGPDVEAIPVSPYRIAYGSTLLMEKELLRRNLMWFQPGLVFEAHKFQYHSTLGSRVIKKKKQGLNVKVWSNEGLSDAVDEYRVTSLMTKRPPPLGPTIGPYA